MTPPGGVVPATSPASCEPPDATCAHARHAAPQREECDRPASAPADHAIPEAKYDMEWISLLIWLTLAGLALPLGAAVLSTPGAGAQMLMCFAGLGLTVLFIILGESAAVGWIIAGVAAIGFLCSSA